MFENILNSLKRNQDIEGIYLYGSRAKNAAQENSDYDIGLLFKTHLGQTLAAHQRTEKMKDTIEKQFNYSLEVDIIDVEAAPIALQHAIINGKLVYNQNPTRLHRLENSILSKTEENFYG